MQILTDIDDLPTGLRLVLCIGVFDGLHRGHRRMLLATVEAARQRDALAVVLTFDPHPDEVLRATVTARLCDPEEKLLRLERLGLGLTVVQRFDREFAGQSAEQFLGRVSGGRELVGVVMTPETAFGHDRAGTLAAVRELGRRNGFDCLEVPEVTLAGGRISSSRLRQALAAGRVGEVRRLLGRDYAVVGRVVRGDARGRQLGFPTANLAFDRPAALPADGIYAVRASWGGADPLSPTRVGEGAASLGVRPTFGGGERTLEVHLFDFDEDLYGERMRVEFVRRQRGERRFVSVDALIEQMHLDADRARRILGARPGRR